jgi:hypothetical protein
MSNNRTFKGHAVWVSKSTLDNYGEHIHETVYTAAIKGHMNGNSLLTFDWLPSASMEGGLLKLFAEDGHHFSGQAAELGSSDQREDVKGYLRISQLGTSAITGTWLRKGEYFYWVAEFSFDPEN